MRDEKQVGPDFARGTDDENTDPDREEGRFSEGQERTETHESEHEGSFAEGQADEPQHEEGMLPGRFSRGQEGGAR
jgi:hypothetical protein